MQPILPNLSDIRKYATFGQQRNASILGILIKADQSQEIKFLHLIQLCPLNHSLHARFRPATNTDR